MLRRRRAASLALWPSLVAGLLLGPGCALSTRPLPYAGRDGSPDTADGLYKLRWTDLGAVFVRPGADFAVFDRIWLEPVKIRQMDPEKAVVRARRNKAVRALELGQDDRERIAQIFHDAFARALSDGGYTIVDAPADGVLQLSSGIDDLYVAVPIWKGGEQTVITDAGEMTLLLNLSDAESGVSLARMVDRRAIVPAGVSLEGAYRSDPVTNWSGVRDVCDAWARAVRIRLQDLTTLSPLPPPPPP